MVREGGGLRTLRARPSLLAYRPGDVQLGLAFLGTMMGGLTPLAVASACGARPALLEAGVEGSLSERAVAAALGAANEASGRVASTTAASAAAAARALRSRRGG